jgi:hypothetical protein
MASAMKERPTAQAQNSEEALAKGAFVGWYNQKVQYYSKSHGQSKLETVSAGTIAVRQKAPGVYDVDVRSRGEYRQPDMAFALGAKGEFRPIINYDQHISLFGIAPEGAQNADLKNLRPVKLK